MWHAGTVVAIALRPEAGSQGSYGSNAARTVTQQLRTKGIYARPLGNVVYLMCTPTTSRMQCSTLLETVAASIAERAHQKMAA